MDLNVTAFVVGLVLAPAISLFAIVTGLDRDRAFYPTVMIVIALLYDLWAVLGGSPRALLLESMAGAVFIGMSVLGFRRNLWWVSAALAAHGVFDFFHGGLIDNPGVPVWWPAFCSAYDIAAAACLSVLLGTGRLRATPA